MVRVDNIRFRRLRLWCIQPEINTFVKKRTAIVFNAYTKTDDIVFADDSIRVWVMRPQLDGESITFERVIKIKIPTDHDDRTALYNAMEFAWRHK
ncbi:hypothetical protein DFQ28_006040, partial [Apophysomyces sp. BC1034]